jgi:hypothetical protein
VWLPAEARREFARLFGFLGQGEELARDCARAQALFAADPAMRGFFAVQARQEAFHALVFARAAAWLGSREPPVPLAPLHNLRVLVEDAVRRQDFAETLLASQVVLEGLGEVVLRQLDAAMTAKRLSSARLSRTILRQERSHHAFGRERLSELIARGQARGEILRRRADSYLALVAQTFEELDDLFEFFEERPGSYMQEVREALPGCLA